MKTFFNFSFLSGTILSGAAILALSGCSPSSHVYAGVEDSQYIGGTRMEYSYRVDNGQYRNHPPKPKHKKDKFRKKMEKQEKKFLKEQRKMEKKQAKKHHRHH